MYYQQQQNVSCDPEVLNLAVQACNELDGVRAQATAIYHQAQTAADSAHKERDYTRDQAQQLWTEAQGTVQNAHAQIQEKDRMLIVAKSQFDHTQQQLQLLV